MKWILIVIAAVIGSLLLGAGIGLGLNLLLHDFPPSMRGAVVVIALAAFIGGVWAGGFLGDMGNNAI